MTRFIYKVPDTLLADKIEQDLRQFADAWLKTTTRGTREPISAFCDVTLRGGKRLRGILAMQSYYAHGGRGEKIALGAARVFELIQTSLLVIDDIADRSDLRRGGPSAHVRLKAYATQNHMKSDALHYGQVQAMNSAHAGIHKAAMELLDLPADPRSIVIASRHFHENITTTLDGQMDDIYIEATNEKVEESDVEAVLARKTPHYTILGPIELGANLAGVHEIEPSLYDYALHVGCAFQIADDIISTFGTESETGKGNNDDIREGKLTLLVHRALSQGTTAQVETLRKILGNANATDAECDTARELLRATGGLRHAEAHLARHKKEALGALKTAAKTNPDFIAYLATLVGYVADRRA